MSVHSLSPTPGLGRVSPHLRVVGACIGAVLLAIPGLFLIVFAALAAAVSDDIEPYR